MLLLLALGIAALPACAHQHTPTVADPGPPPTRRAERPSYVPGHVWIPGRWDRRDGQWVWRAGHHERQRPGHAYVAGQWCNEGGRWVWRAGAWRKSGRVVVFER